MVSHLLHDKPSLPPLKIAPSHGGGSGSPSNTRFLRPIRVLNPNGISNDSGCSAVFAGLTVVTDRQTDRPRCISNNSPHRHVGLRSNAMRPHNITTVYAFRQNRPLIVQSCVCSECATGSKKHDNDVCRTTAVDSFPRGSRPIIGSSLSTVFFDREVNCELSTS